MVGVGVPRLGTRGDQTTSTTRRLNPETTLRTIVLGLTAPRRERDRDGRRELAPPWQGSPLRQPSGQAPRQPSQPGPP